MTLPSTRLELPCLFSYAFLEHFIKSSVTLSNQYNQPVKVTSFTFNKLIQICYNVLRTLKWLLLCLLFIFLNTLCVDCKELHGLRLSRDHSSLDKTSAYYSASASSFSHNHTSSIHRLKCKDGLVVPAWRPMENLSNGDIIARGLVYFFALIYLFVGVSIIADRFMAAIEVITSQEREVKIKKPNGEVQIINVRIWNETVSNLTLMALGSSAPEILLSIIEVYAQNFEAGDLGPGTIVGSAAFNLFVIIAICVWVVPSTEVKKIKHLRVFFVTMIWSVLAYIWLLAILSVITPRVVDIWEALLTFAFFPMTVITAYMADRRFLVFKYLPKKYRMNRRGVIVGGEGDTEDIEMGSKVIANHVPDGTFKVFQEEDNEEVKEFEENRREFITLLRDLRKKNPDTSLPDIERMALEEIINKGPKSRAYYRLQVIISLSFCLSPPLASFFNKKANMCPKKST